MMEDLITDLRNMTHLGRFARSEVADILGYLEGLGWLSAPKAEDLVNNLPAHEPPLIPEPPVADRPMFPAVDNLVEIAPAEPVLSDSAFDAMAAAAEFNPHV